MANEKHRRSSHEDDLIFDDGTTFDDVTAYIPSDAEVLRNPQKKEECDNEEG